MEITAHGTLTRFNVSFGKQANLIFAYRKITRRSTAVSSLPLSIVAVPFMFTRVQKSWFELKKIRASMVGLRLPSKWDR